MKLIKRMCFLALGAIMICCWVVTLGVIPVVDDYIKNASDIAGKINKSELIAYKPDTQVFDANNNVIGEVGKNNFEFCSLDNVSPYIVNGYVAVEDKDFYNHHGINYRGIIRAVKTMLSNNGVATQGGSSITQQLVKTTILSPERTIERKITEMLIALELEHQMTKQEILETYLNAISYGNNCMGIKKASEFYFNKEPANLEPYEAAMLIGLTNNPTAYNPLNNPEKAKEKRDVVLDVMRDDGIITEEQYAESISKDLSLNINYNSNNYNSYEVSFALHCATLALMERDGFEFKYVFRTEAEQAGYKEHYRAVYESYSNKLKDGGYSIYTSIDSVKQKQLLAQVQKALAGQKKLAENGLHELQAAAVMVNNKTGFVNAVVGGRGDEGDSFNRAYLAARQPGSTIKPLMVYGPAFDTEDYKPSTKIDAKNTSKGPKNVNNEVYNKVTIKQAVRDSINTAAFNLFVKLGPESAIKYMELLKFSSLSYDDTYNNSVALGGFTNGVYPWEMAKAYSTIARGGVSNSATCIIRIAENGEDIYTYKERRASVYSEQSAAYLLECLESVIENGTGRMAGMKNISVAGKTGTTNNNKDGWFCGFTPEYTVAVWCGCDQPKSMRSLYGASYPLQIFKGFMTEVYSKEKSGTFKELLEITKKAEEEEAEEEVTTKPAIEEKEYKLNDYLTLTLTNLDDYDEYMKIGERVKESATGYDALLKIDVQTRKLTDQKNKLERDKRVLEAEEALLELANKETVEAYKEAQKKVNLCKDYDCYTDMEYRLSLAKSSIDFTEDKQ